MTPRRPGSPYWRWATVLVAVVAAGYWAAFMVATHLPGRAVDRLNPFDFGDLPVDKLIHFTCYAIGTALIALALWARRRWNASSAAVVVIVLGLWGGVDELLQSLVPGRSADPLDWIADLSGILVGAGLTLWLLPPRSDNGSNHPKAA